MRAAVLKYALQSFQPPELPTERLVPREHFNIVSKSRAKTLNHMLGGNPTTRWSPRQKSNATDDGGSRYVSKHQ